MKKFNSNKKAKAFTVKGAAALIIAAILALVFTGCPNNAGGSGSGSATPPVPPTPTPTPKPKHAIAFSVDSTTPNGTLKAKADDVPETEASPITVEEGKTVTFTATPSPGYKVKEWKADGTVVTGNTSNTYTCTVTKAVHITVSFAPLDVGSFKDTGDGFIKITPPAKGIVGVDHDYTLPGTNNYWKGVFRAGRKVKLSPYKLGKTEVTYELWHEVRTWAESKGYVFANKGLEGWDGTGGGGDYPNYANIGKPPTANKNHPVTMISWRDCIVWCNAYTHKMNNADTECVYRKKDDHMVVLKNATDTAACDAAYADMKKKGFRLPTEAEWEYAARWQGSNTENAAQYGDVWLTKLNSASGAKDKWDTAETGEVAWYWDNSGYKTHPVGEKRANALGLCDMSGNVWEWCFDWYDTIAAENVIDPQGGASGTGRVKRGGSWNRDAHDCTVGRRYNSSAGGRDYDLVFRLACLP